MSGAKQSLAFIGLGSMGWPMAARLAAAGYGVLGTDASSDRSLAFAERHGIAGATADAAGVRSCQIVVTMLPTSAIVEQVLLGPGGLAAALQPGTLVLEMSSGVPAHTARIAEMLAEKGARLVDAPVSGRVKRA